MDEYDQRRLRKIEAKLDLLLGLAAAGALIFGAEWLGKRWAQDWDWSEGFAHFAALFFIGLLIWWQAKTIDRA